MARNVGLVQMTREQMDEYGIEARKRMIDAKRAQVASLAKKVEEALCGSSKDFNKAMKAAAEAGQRLDEMEAEFRRWLESHGLILNDM